MTIPVQDEKEIYTTWDQNVLTSATDKGSLSEIAPCSHEEADTRIFLHVKNAYLSGHQRIMIRTSDTDVVVLAVSMAGTLPNCELWVAYGTVKSLRYMCATQISLKLGIEKSKVLPMFHALTGCGTVSFFAGRGKKSAWGLWNVFPQLTDVISALMARPEGVEDSMAVIERFVTLLYDRTSNLMQVNDARKDLFSRKSRSLEKIPPTGAALLQHTKRAVYQAGHIWSQADVTEPVIPSPSAWGMGARGQALENKVDNPTVG